MRLISNYVYYLQPEQIAGWINNTQKEDRL